MGEVTVKVDFEGKTYLGRGLSTDIIEASAKAYINAINKVEYELSR
jgi:2-isopropylmalate synthase